MKFRIAQFRTSESSSIQSGPGRSAAGRTLAGAGHDHPRTLRWASVLTVAAVLGALVTVVVGAPLAAAEPVPVQQRPAGLVTADSLPTTQINGVAWTQVILGNTVYVGGSFTSARPAGSALGVNEVPRNNILAYNLTTGELLTTFAPNLNGQVKALALSPDGSRLYAGGSFTSVDGVARYRLAALNPVTGALLTNFTAGVDSTVNAIIATNSTVYFGGTFSSAGGQARSRLAAYAVSTNTLTTWAPAADNRVNALIMTPDGSKVVVGGAFMNMNGASAIGIAALDATTGASQAWNVNLVVRNGGPNAAILTLATDGTYIYGGGYKFGTGGNLEGVFRADPTTGTVQWVEDCHGDTYSIYPSPAALYQVGHAHYCGNDMGWPQPAVWNFNRAIAFTKDATGTLTRDPFGGGYVSYGGTASPSLYSWFPRMDIGSFTGQNQAAWSVTGNANYVVVGGEFPLVNNGAQQGLARFAVKPIAPAKQSMRLSGTSYVPTLSSPSSGTVRINFLANWDRDDRTLTYKLLRTGTTLPIYTTVVDSSEFERPAIGYTDTGLTPGLLYTYRINVTDGDGNTVTGNSASIVAASSGALTSYGQTVLAQGASLYWPLNEAAGTVAKDYAGYNDAVLNTGVTVGTAGAIPGDTGMTFSGATNGDLVGGGTITPPNTFTLSAWFKTTNTAGGRIIGFSDLPTGTSAHRDRQIYLSNTGKVSFGVYSTAANYMTSSKSYNDGVWHQAVATLSGNGMSLYVDGARVGQRSDVTYGEKYLGYWRVGGDNIGGWNNAGTTGNFAGVIDEVSIYPTALTFQQINDQYVASGRTPTIPSAPSDSYGAMIYADEPTLYYRLAETSGSVAADSGPVNSPGGYQGTTTKNVAGALAANPNTAVTVNGSSGFISSNASFVNPTTYSAEAWFKSTSATGGSIIGFGAARTGLSGTADRQVYLRNDGSLAFRAGTGAQTTFVTSSTGFNNGQWHHVVATQGVAGMVLYVDGAAVASNVAVTSGNYTGYWRVGADITNGGSTSSYLNGTVDEAAVYSTVLSAARVLQHYELGHGGPANTPPTASFTATPTNLSVAFNASASADPGGSIASYAWTYGDSTTGTGVTPTKVYAAAGTYTVTLTVTDNLGATGTATQQVTVVAPNVPPTAEFSATATNLSVAFDAGASLDSDGSIATYAWDFGDGSTGSGLTTSHTYVAGTYLVTLTVTDNQGAPSSVTHSVTATDPPNVPPTAAFVATVDHLELDVDAVTSSDSDGSIVGYAWDFGDGTTGTGVSTSHIYGADGTYLVTLTVTDDDGGTDGADQSVSVLANYLPTADISASATQLTLSVDASGSTDPDGSIVGFGWDFGDGSTETTATASHTYAVAGTYLLTLTVTDNGGATAVATQSVTVALANVPPTAAISATPTDATVAFDGSGSTDPDGSVSSYAWTFGDGATGTGVAPSHTYAASGTYTVGLTVTDNQGATGSTSTSVPVTVPNVPPTAAISQSTSGLTVSVNGSDSTDSDGTITGYAWTFGDGSTATGATASRTYAAPGTYTVALTVTDNLGATGTTSTSVTVAIAVFANDTFARTVASGWGTANVGGAWTMGAGTPVGSVSGGYGRLPIAVGATRIATLATVSQSNIDLRLTIALDKPATGGSTMVSAVGRKTATGEYRLTAVFSTTPGKVNLRLDRVVGSTTTSLTNVVVTGLTYTTGTDLNLRFQISPASPTTTLLQGKAWLASGAEPPTWFTSTTDTGSVLPAGSVGVVGYVSGSATNAPVTASYKALNVQALGAP